MGLSHNKHAFLKPHRLKESDTIVVISPAGCVKRGSILKSGRLFAMNGIRLKYLKSVFGRDRYLAGKDKDRLEDIRTAFSVERYRGVLCSRGGFGSMRILRGLGEFEFRDIKPLFGFSDVTALHIFFNNRGWITFHSPNLNGFYNLTERAKRHFFEVLLGDVSRLRFEAEYTLKKGMVEGRLIGGNLSIVSAISGTEFDIDLRDKILLLEDVNEEPYRIDRMLTQLSLRSDISQLRGVVFGRFVGCGSGSELKDVFMDFIRRIDIPAIYGVEVGHIRNNLAIPLNIRYSLDASRCMLLPLEEPFL